MSTGGLLVVVLGVIGRDNRPVLSEDAGWVGTMAVAMAAAFVGAMIVGPIVRRRARRKRGTPEE